MNETVRWNVAVSAETDRALRVFMDSNGGKKKNDLSYFIEEAVSCYLFDQAAKQIKDANRNIDEEELTAMVDEAVEWARNAS